MPLLLVRYLDQAAWDADYPAAFRKMVNKYANLRMNPATKGPAMITGT